MHNSNHVILEEGVGCDSNGSHDPSPTHSFDNNFSQKIFCSTEDDSFGLVVNSNNNNSQITYSNKVHEYSESNPSVIKAWEENFNKLNNQFDTLKEKKKLSYLVDQKLIADRQYHLHKQALKTAVESTNGDWKKEYAAYTYEIQCQLMQKFSESFQDYTKDKKVLQQLQNLLLSSGSNKTVIGTKNIMNNIQKVFEAVIEQQFLSFQNIEQDGCMFINDKKRTETIAKFLCFGFKQAIWLVNTLDLQRKGTIDLTTTEPAQQQQQPPAPIIQIKNIVPQILQDELNDLSREKKELMQKVKILEAKGQQFFELKKVLAQHYNGDETAIEGMEADIVADMLKKRDSAMLNLCKKFFDIPNDPERQIEKALAVLQKITQDIKLPITCTVEDFFKRQAELLGKQKKTLEKTKEKARKRLQNLEKIASQGDSLHKLFKTESQQIAQKMALLTDYFGKFADTFSPFLEVETDAVESQVGLEQSTERSVVSIAPSESITNRPEHHHPNNNNGQRKPLDHGAIKKKINNNKKK